MTGTLVMVLTGVGGYALGTLQVLFLDWWKDRASHGRHLRAVSSELRRVRTYLNKFDWPDSGPPSDYVKKPPAVTPHFAEMVLSVRWALTGEYLNDNTPDVLFFVLDGVDMLQHYAGQIDLRLNRLRDEQGPSKRDVLKREAVQFTREYDKVVSGLQRLVDTGLDDLAGRELELRLHRQLARAFVRLKRDPDPEDIPTIGPDGKLSSGSA